MWKKNKIALMLRNKSKFRLFKKNITTKTEDKTNNKPHTHYIPTNWNE